MESNNSASSAASAMPQASMPWNVSYTQISIHIPFGPDANQSDQNMQSSQSMPQGLPPGLDNFFSLLAPMMFGPPHPSFAFSNAPASAMQPEIAASETPMESQDSLDAGVSEPRPQASTSSTGPQRFAQMHIPGQFVFQPVNMGGQIVMIPVFIPDAVTQQSLQGQPPASKYALEHQVINRVLNLPNQESSLSHSHGLGSCAICLDDYSQGVRVSELPCKHQYHPECIQEWLKCSNMCPQCRHELLTDNGEYNVGVEQRMKQREQSQKSMDPLNTEEAVPSSTHLPPAAEFLQSQVGPIPSSSSSSEDCIIL